MDNLVNEFPSEDNPFVNVGKEVRSKSLATSTVLIAGCRFLFVLYN